MTLASKSRTLSPNSSRRRRVGAGISFGAAVLLVLAATFVGSAGAAGARTIVHDAGARSADDGTCPIGATCVTIPAVCPAGTTCPEVVATNPSDLADGEALQVSLANFPAGKVAYLKYCANPAPVTYPPACSSDNVFGPLNLPSTEVVAPNNGGADVAFEVLSNPPGPSAQPYNAQKGAVPTDGFYCDNGTNPCSVDVVVGTLGNPTPTMSAKTTAIIPITFAVPGTGCAPTTPTLTSEQSWTVERLLPAVNRVACNASPPVLAFGVTNDSETVAADVGRGSAQIGFTDDPEDPATQALLAKGHFALVPVAVSATVIGLRGATASIPSPIQPNSRPLVTQWNLTPNEVAGVLTGLYNHITLADVTAADPVTPAQAPWCSSASCSVMAQINVQPAPFNLLTGTKLGAYFYANASGTSAQITDWLCNAPNRALTVSGSSWTDPTTASQTFTTSNGLAPGVQWPITKCETFHSLGPEILTPKFPPIVPQLLTANSPADLSTSMNKWTANNESSGGTQFGSNVAFGLMDSSEASFFGYVDASLQNASGAFVAPSAASVAAALAEATAEPDGSLALDYRTLPASSIAYPLPMITYAIVPTTPQPAVQAAQMKSLLLSLLSVTGGTGAAHASDLPSGYFPLPDALTVKAVAAVSADIHVVSNTPSTTSPTTSTTLPLVTAHLPGPTTPGDGLGAPLGGLEGVPGQVSSPSLTSPGVGPGPNATGPPSSGKNSGNVSLEPAAAHLAAPAGSALATASARWVLVALLLAAVLALLLGPALLFGPSLKPSARLKSVRSLLARLRIRRPGHV